jgi:hypothetical protein
MNAWTLVHIMTGTVLVTHPLEGSVAPYRWRLGPEKPQVQVHRSVAHGETLSPLKT